VAVAAAEIAEMLERAEGLVGENPFLEFRLDALRQPEQLLERIGPFRQAHPEAVLLGTCRRVACGGHFAGSSGSELEILGKAAESGFQLVDLELESAQERDPAEVAGLRSRAGLVLSYHDFQRTPALQEVFAAMRAVEADYYKLATTATCLYDSVAMLRFLPQASRDHAVAGMCMGEQGIVSRVLGVRAGGAFTFASPGTGQETAPGQVDAQTLRERYRIGQLNPATRIYGVAGNPVAQSLSPRTMNAAFRRENVNAIYLPLPVSELDDLLACVRDLPLAGLSVTMPLKQQIVKHLDSADPLTRKTGACNTVVRTEDGRLCGFNTDVAGVVAPLEQRLPLAGAQVLVIGAGGAARAAVYGLKDRGAAVYIVNRTPAVGRRLALEAEAVYLDREEIRTRSFDVIVNATPVGMGGTGSPLEEQEIRARFVLDMVYSVQETPLAQAARHAGAEVVSGAEMFVRQGARQFEIWTGRPAPIQEMFEVVSAELATRAGRAAQPAEALPKA
jgi:3-dehydroquinate dehydratase/shikimate dehydrogenase